jgi:hypothetical protein
MAVLSPEKFAMSCAGEKKKRSELRGVRWTETTSIRPGEAIWRVPQSFAMILHVSFFHIGRWLWSG